MKICGIEAPTRKFEMKLVLTALVRDEEDILRPFLEYHLHRGVDYLVVTDNLSVDGTREILEEYRRIGKLLYIHEPEDNYAQSVWVTRMARLAAEEFAADWVINSDADEFWWPEQAADLKEVLRAVPPSISALSSLRTNFLPRPRQGDQNILRSMIYREVRSTNSLGQPLPPKICHRANPRVVIEQGNHVISVGGVEVDAVQTDELSIFHFPMRSSQQFINKIEKGGAAYARSGLPPDVGETWRTLYQRHREERTLDDYFERHVVDDETLAAKLASGELVEDRRLLELLTSLAVV